MKYIFTFLLLILLNLKGSSQDLGKIYGDIIKEVNSDTSLSNIQTNKEENFYYIQADGLAPIVKQCWYFRYDTGKCYATRLFCQSAMLNHAVKKLNKDLVSVGEMMWRDYATTSITTIAKYENWFVIETTTE